MSANILITQSQLRNYSGSEMVTLELAEHFVENGDTVTILTHHISSPMKEEFESLNIKIILTTTAEANLLDARNYSTIWVHHYTLTEGLIRTIGLSDTIVIFNHMSSSEPFEAVIFPEEEERLASLIVFNSPETEKKAQEAAYGLMNRRLRGVSLFTNPAPDNFFQSLKRTSRSLSRIAVVSNHPPTELDAAMELVKTSGIKVDFIGRTKENKVMRVNAEVLSKYDSIVSIGKTVQYGLALQIPVYCYDRFGGPGYINEKNFENAEFNNFSGRGFATKDAAQIADEIINNFPAVTRYFKNSIDNHRSQYRLSTQLSKIMMEATKNMTQRSTNSSYYNLIQYSNLLTRLVPGHTQQEHISRHLIKNMKRTIENLTKKQSQQNKQINSIESQLKKRAAKYTEAVNEIRNIQFSTSYKVGRIVTFIPRSIKRISPKKIKRNSIK